MYQEIALPKIAEIAQWQSPQCLSERLRLRNELAFIQGDRAHGGPPREELAAALKCRLAALQRQLEQLAQVEPLAQKL